MIGLDTNVLLRWLVDESIWPDDAPHQTAAVSELINTGGNTFFVNHVVIAETIWVLTSGMKQSKGSVAEVIQRLLLSANVKVDRLDVVEDALQTYLAGNGDFADHLIAAINQAGGCSTTVTFDNKASKSGRFSRLPA